MLPTLSWARVDSRRAAIMGCGHTGSFIASTLAEEGWSLRVVDPDPDSFSLLPKGMVDDGRIRTVVGDGTREMSLRKAFVHDAHVFIAVSGKSASNIMAAQIARHVLHLPTVVCRVDHPISREVYEKLGIVTVSTEALVADAILRATRQ